VNASVLSSVDGTVLLTPVMAPCELGAIAPTGVMACLNKGGGGTTLSVQLFDADFNLIAEVTPFTPGWPDFAPIQSDNGSLFFLSDGNSFHSVIKAIDAATGAPVDSWTLTNTAAVNSLAVSRDGTILYWTDVNTLVMHAYDLVGHADLPDLFTVPSDPSYGLSFDLYVLPNGDLLFAVCKNGAPHDCEVQRWNSAGVHQATYPFGNNTDNASFPFIAIDPGDQTTFWIRLFPPNDTNDYLQVRISDGVTLNSFNLPNITSAGDIPFCCPMFITASVVASASARMTQLPLEIAYDYTVLQPFVVGTGLNWRTPPS
jgi:hypothetical protein